jgi:hypothetical protein
MGISVVLRTESQEVLDGVDDDKNLLHVLLEPHDSAPILSTVDWYGDTIFNRLQMQQFLSEWEMLRRIASTPDEAALVEKVKALALRCQSEPHLYLAFIGD